MLLFSPKTEKPDWVIGVGKSPRFPSSEYLTGFESAKKDRDGQEADAMKIAIENARRTLTEKIRVTIRSSVETKLEETNNVGSSYVNSITQATTTLDLQGLEGDTYYDDDERMCYAFAYVKREDLAIAYSKKAENIRRELQNHFSIGSQYETGGNIPMALNEYRSCYPLFAKLEEAEAILAVASKSTPVSDDSLRGNQASDEIDIARVRSAISHLTQRPIRSTEDLAWYLSYNLQERSDAKQISVIVAPPTYQSTGIVSPFSLFFKQNLVTQLSQKPNWRIIEQTISNPTASGDLTREFAVASGADYLLNGTYWQQGDSLKCFLYLRQVRTNQNEAIAEALVPTSIIAATKQPFIPQNVEQTVADLRQFRKDEIVNDGLRVDVWTNKGKEGVVFTEGEIMEVYLRVNQPCHVRFIYHQANRTRVVLLYDEFIPEEQTNKEFKIKTRFICGPPFGTEFLQVIAQTKQPMPRVDTTQIGKDIFLTEDLQTVLPKLRGMSTNTEMGDTDILRAEQRIQINALPKQ